MAGSSTVAMSDPQPVSTGRMQTVAGQDEARRELLLALSRSVAESACRGLHGEHIVSVLTSLLSQEVRLLEERRANERSY